MTVGEEIVKLRQIQRERTLTVSTITEGKNMKKGVGAALMSPSGAAGTPSSSVLTNPSALASPAALLSPSGTRRPPKCPFFIPAFQSGCVRDDACLFYHEKAACTAVMTSAGHCPLGFRCDYRHVPLSGPGQKRRYLEVAATIKPDQFGLIPPRFRSGHGTSYYLKGVRKVFSMVPVEEAAEFPPDDVRSCPVYGPPVLDLFHLRAEFPVHVHPLSDPHMR